MHSGFNMALLSYFLKAKANLTVQYFEKLIELTAPPGPALVYPLVSHVHACMATVFPTCVSVDVDLNLDVDNSLLNASWWQHI